MRRRKTCNYCKKEVPEEFGTPTILWSYFIAGNHPAKGWPKVAYCNGKCRLRHNLLMNPLRPFLAPIGLIIVALIIYSWINIYTSEVGFLESHSEGDIFFLYLWSLLGSASFLYGMASLLTRLYYYLSLSRSKEKEASSLLRP